MPENAKFKKLIRARMERTGETYTQARDALLRERDEGVVVVTPDPLRASIQAVLDAQPDLSYFGFRTRPGRGEDASAAAAEFAEKRAHLLSADGVQQVGKCLEYLALVRKTRTARPADGRSTPGSYGLKHDVEAWLAARGKTDDNGYIGNGAFIVAALVAGFPLHRSEPGRSPNCSVGVNREDVRAVSEGKDPREWRKTTAFVKWLFAQAGRGDPVGDLAGDAKADFKFPRRGNIAELRSYLSFFGEHTEAAFEAARREYRALA